MKLFAHCKWFIVRWWGLVPGSPKGSGPQAYKMAVGEYWTTVINTYNACNLNCFEMQNSNSFGIFFINKYSTIPTTLKCGILIQILIYIHTTWTTLKCRIVIHLLFFYKYSAIPTTLKCGILIQILVYIHTTWTTLKCRIIIHLLFYKYFTIQTALKWRIVIHLVFFTNTPHSRPLWNVAF